MHNEFQQENVDLSNVMRHQDNDREPMPDALNVRRAEMDRSDGSWRKESRSRSGNRFQPIERHKFNAMTFEDKNKPKPLPKNPQYSHV